MLSESNLLQNNYKTEKGKKKKKIHPSYVNSQLGNRMDCHFFPFADNTHIYIM